MNRTIETSLMIVAGAALAAGAQWTPMIGDVQHSNNEAAFPSIAAAQIDEARTDEAWTLEPGFFDQQAFVRVIPCEDTVNNRTHSTGSSTIISNDQDGGFAVTITDGELQKIEAKGEYTLEENGDTVRILDASGEVVFETSKTDPSIDGDRFPFHVLGDVLAPAAPRSRATLGARLAPAGEAMSAQLGIDKGLVVEFVTPGSGADAAGLQQHDVLIGVADKPLENWSLMEALGEHKPGDVVSVELIRKGERQTFEITLDASPAIAPRFNARRFGTDTMNEMELLRQMLHSQWRDAQRAPRPIVIPRAAPGLRAPEQPDATPAPQQNPNAIDASEMAPKARTRSVPA